MKLFKVKGHTSRTRYGNVFFAFVIAENDVEARRIAEEEIWSLGGTEILSVTEEDTENWPRLLCICTEDDI